MIDQQLADTIVSPEAYQAGEPIDAAFRQIRRDTPFAQAQPREFDKFWVVSRHADVMEVERRASDFLNGPRSSVVSNMQNEAAVRFLTGGEGNLIRSLVAVDGAEHKALRGVVFPAMTPAAVRQLEARVRTIAKQYVDDMLARAPECDFAEEIAFWYPLRVIMGVLGLPEEDEPYLMRLTQELFSAGEWLMLPYHSANRDEDVFDDPFEFRIDRQPNRHVAFGYGPHVCLGQHLARLEMRLFWEELFPRMKRVELTAPPQRTLSSFVCGPKHVPIRFEVA